MTQAIPEVAIEHEEGGKWTVKYQPVDAEGTPIGRLQVITAETQQELIQKQATAHIEATRALHSGRKKLDPKDVDPKKAPVVTPAEMSSDEDIQLVSDLMNPKTARKAILKAWESEAKVPVSEIRPAVETASSVDVKFEVEAWMRDHVQDYYGCKPNQDTLMSFLNENDMSLTYRNLEIAFKELQDRLVQRPAAPAEEVTDEPETIPPVRRSAASGLIPGETSPSRPTGRTPGLTWADVDALDYGEFKSKQQEPKWNAAYLELCRTQPRVKRR